MHLRRLAPLAVAPLAALAAVPVAGAAPITRTVSGGGLVVTATGEAGAPGNLGGEVRIAIDRAGARLFEAPVHAPGCEVEGTGTCWLPGWDEGADAVRIRDLDGDGEPEVLVDQDTGGAHCCLGVTVLGLTRDALGAPSGYRATSRGFASSGYVLRTIDGAAILASGDVRFEDRWTAHVLSAVPLRLWRFSAATGRFVDVTAEHPDRIRSDRRALRRTLDRVLRDRADARGSAAAWAADSYRLGLRDRALRTLRRWADRRVLLPREGGRRSAAANRAFVRGLDRLLRRLGYHRS